MAITHYIEFRKNANLTLENGLAQGGIVRADLEKQFWGDIFGAVTDKYGIGWSNTNNVGNRCGAAVVPDSASRVYHFLKVTVNGKAVTVTPTDENGNPFDVQTYNF